MLATFSIDILSWKTCFSFSWPSASHPISNLVFIHFSSLSAIVTKGAWSVFPTKGIIARFSLFRSKSIFCKYLNISSFCFVNLSYCWLIISNSFSYPVTLSLKSHQIFLWRFSLGLYHTPTFPITSYRVYHPPIWGHVNLACFLKYCVLSNHRLRQSARTTVLSPLQASYKGNTCFF